MLDLLRFLGVGQYWQPGDNETEPRLLHTVNISQSQPEWLAYPLYGLAAPVIIFATIITNTLVVIVLCSKHLRTPTNYILLSMSITELMTGLSSSPWFLYYYTFDGYKDDRIHGLSSFWCIAHPYFAVHLPTIFHTSAIWLTVYLAIQRYVYVCVPQLVHHYFSYDHARWMICFICFTAFFAELPTLFTEYSVSFPVNNTRICKRKYVDLLDEMPGGVNTWKATHLCARAFFVHILPCILLIVFTAALFKTVNAADRKRSTHQMPSRKFLNNDISDSSASGCLAASNRLMHATTRMLVVVIAIFLLIEIPVALIFITHLLVIFFHLLDMQAYQTLNNLLIMRNLFIILTYPLNFAIYFGMSSSFKLQFRQLFSRKILYVASPAEGGWRPRFSVQLIDIHKMRRTSKQHANYKSKNSHATDNGACKANLVPSPSRGSVVSQALSTFSEYSLQHLQAFVLKKQSDTQRPPSIAPDPLSTADVFL